MSKIIVIVLSLFGLIHSSVGVLSQPGQCNELSQKHDFNIIAFLGQWQETWRTGNPGEGNECSTVLASVEGVSGEEDESGEEDKYILLNRAVDNNFLLEQIGDIQNITNGTIRVIFRGVPEPVELIVLDTDYSVYSILYTCVDTSPVTRSLGVSVMLLPNFPITDMVTTPLNITLFNNLGIMLDDLREVDHSYDVCYELPVIESGPIILPGLCDTPNAYPNFIPDQFTGVWHEISSYYSKNILGTCARAEYSMGSEGIIVKNNQVVNQTLLVISGNATVISSDNSGILRVTLEVLPGVFETQDLWILNTDNFNYAVLYSCVDLPDTNQKRVYSWILGRSSDLPGDAQLAVTSVINSRIDLNTRYYQDTLRSDDDCFYYPEFDGQPVVFRGICDQSIPVMPEFDPLLYTGIWYNIESYPSQFQIGTCVNANYQLGANGVEVLNSQVVNERLVTISGYAVASDQEPGKLVVSFPIEGTNLTTQTDYWVLDTDYNTYALVYTCIDLENRERAVLSWKLGRSKSLTQGAVENITAIISTIPVLDAKYYVEENQTPEGCFYYPDPLPGVPVLFPGQCDYNITTQANFDLARFASTWYDVEAYPIDNQASRCRSYEFSSGSGNTLSLVLTQIIDQFLNVNIGNVTSDPADSAKLTTSFISNGELIEIPLWILSTDYDNYALAYSCIQNDDFRRIYSWKLSKNTTLSDESRAAIDAVIEPIQVLNNSYYETVDHSLDACFYLPDLAPGEPIILVGQCDQNIPVVSNFQPELYLGTWRVISSYPSDFQNGTCLDTTYSPVGTTIEVYNTQVIDEELNTITGTAVLASNDTSGKLIVNFPGAPEPAEYWILDTDYLKYSLVYSCRDISATQRRVWSWKLSRTDELDEEDNEKINEIINNVQVLHDRYYQTVNRTREACFYYPEVDGNPLVFRGQCEDIPVMQNFNAALYQGLWHNIESFPSLTQPGECNNARYTIADDSVIVFNTEVINQTLSTITGYAFPSIEEPAKLVVNFPSVGTETSDYWILNTDYDSYSLVYTCLNDGPDYRRVWSWKLGRTKELLPPALEAINNVTRNIKVLDARYYVQRNQTPEACFYFPEPVPGQPVVFPGQCDQSITTMNNFNISQFRGRWHEIDAYPTGQDQGDCINHIISDGLGDSLNIMTNRVFDLSLNTVNSVLNETGDDGKLSITITTPTGVVTMPFWIIDTDYDDYALAYSCVNNNDDTRNVYSWKLSRFRYLTPTGENRTNEAMESIDVLDNMYYERVSHTDDSCFYLPDLEPGAPVIFPGQCDTTIGVVSSFNALDFLGQWRLISSYPSEFQVGTCSDAFYEILPDGTIEVHNTEVVNQTLSTINGTAELVGNGTYGKLLISFPTAPQPIEYWILDTDYADYALIYSCVNLNSEQRQVWSWKLGRSDSLNDTAMQAIDNVIGGINVLNDKYFADIGRTEDDCFYFPEPTNDPVIFRGQCNLSIPVVQNFMPDLYNGTWYTIESYPNEFQFGTCLTAQYTINEETGIIEVYNTQVVNERLDSISATAVPASNDGQAMLNVTFPFPGYEIVTPYWVIDTDYDNYALVYSCINVNDEYMRVGSWKLSRHQNLTAESNTAINDAMSGIRVIDQRYFLTWDQEDCFYYPELTDGRVILPGQCEDNRIVVVDNFTATNFAGSWREAARFPSEYQTGECAASGFHLSDDVYTLTKTIIQNERLITMTGSATFAENGTGIISANLSDGNGTSINLNMYILETDYTNFALIYGCNDIGDNSKQIFSWKLSRTRAGLSQDAINIINERVLITRDLDEDYYHYTDQSDDACFYYPRFDELPNRIELPGPCDNTIRGVSNFDVNAYSGRWFETARYPEPEQIGTCSRAHYNPLSQYVDVLNTEVVNKTLRTRSGSATLASTDGSGELAVTFTVDGEVRTVPLFILATDYTSYALAYSCRNLENGNRTVSSWKLSRVRTLNNNNEVDQVILDTQGLIEEYYLPTSQSDEDCFYVPAVNTEEAPLFRGQCEDIVGQLNFDVHRFLGLWHEVESYARDSSAGDCFSSYYLSASGNQINVVETGIFDVTAQHTTGSVTADEYGRLTRTMNNGSSTYRQDVVVLSTDYNSYALLYSCENFNDEYRRVWSGKYSRTRSGQFSAESQNIINNLIEDNELLYPELYQDVDQSDAACFHYPEQTGQQIILPGHCDENIPVQTNFSVHEYTGIWYQSERYPQVYESGTCIGARYTLNEDTGVVKVLNWQVIDEELVTIEGTAVLLNSTDGSAKLLVRLPFEDTEEMVETTLYVLSTDYVSYSLAYTCTNVGDDQRAVGAWKLSRNRTMPATGNDAIDALIAIRDELHQPYFISVEQHDECDEPSSSTIFRSSIIVTLLCIAFKMLF